MSFQRTIDPDAKTDYGVDWSDWLASDEDAGWQVGDSTIASSTWLISPAGPTLSDESNDDTSTVVWVSGCTDGVVYTLTNRITISGTPTGSNDRSITLICEER